MLGILKHFDLEREILDKLPSELCAIDREGKIIFVNQAWKQFADANHLLDKNYDIGVNYLTVINQAIDANVEGARQILQGIKDILNGSKDIFQHEYPCNSPEEQRWFLLYATPLTRRGAAVIMHINITDRKLGEIKLSEQLDEVSRLNKLMLTREDKIIELKEQLEDCHSKKKDGNVGS